MGNAGIRGSVRVFFCGGGPEAGSGGLVPCGHGGAGSAHVNRTQPAGPPGPRGPQGPSGQSVPELTAAMGPIRDAGPLSRTMGREMEADSRTPPAVLDAISQAVTQAHGRAALAQSGAVHRTARVGEREAGTVGGRGGWGSGGG